MDSPENTAESQIITISFLTKKIKAKDNLGNVIVLELSIFDVIDAYGPFSAAMNHAIKKVLCPGQRGSKDRITDLKEAIVSIQHEIESETELILPEQKTEPKKKEVITPPPLHALPPFVKEGDQIFVGELELKENCHEFYNYTSVRGQGLRKEKQHWTACRFCGQLIEEYDEKTQCPKFNSPLGNGMNDMGDTFYQTQTKFNQMIGDLDRILSLMILIAKKEETDEANWQTLKHHAEDMVGAGQKILEMFKNKDAA